MRKAIPPCQQHLPLLLRAVSSPVFVPHHSWGPIFRPLTPAHPRANRPLTYLYPQLPPSRSSTPTALTNEQLPRLVHTVISTTYALHKTIHLRVCCSDPLARRRTRHHPSLLAHTITTTFLLQLGPVPPILPSAGLLCLAPTSIREFGIQHSPGITP